MSWPLQVPAFEATPLSCGSLARVKCGVLWGPWPCLPRLTTKPFHSKALETPLTCPLLLGLIVHVSNKPREEPCYLGPVPHDPYPISPGGNPGNNLQGPNAYQNLNNLNNFIAFTIPSRLWNFETGRHLFLLFCCCFSLCCATPVP